MKQTNRLYSLQTLLAFGLGILIFILCISFTGCAGSRGGCAATYGKSGY